MTATNAKTAAALVEITGNTYPVKDALKAMGARWNADKKCWMIAASKAQEAAAIVKTAPAKPAFAARPSAHRSSFPRVRGGSWVCPACTEENTASASHCWECGCGRGNR